MEFNNTTIAIIIIVVILIITFLYYFLNNKKVIKPSHIIEQIDVLPIDASEDMEELLQEHLADTAVYTDKVLYEDQTQKPKMKHILFEFEMNHTVNIINKMEIFSEPVLLENIVILRQNYIYYLIINFEKYVTVDHINIVLENREEIKEYNSSGAKCALENGKYIQSPLYPSIFLMNLDKSLLVMNYVS